MADSKISALTELTSPAVDDELVIVDKSDTTMAASGTNKRIKHSAYGWNSGTHAARPAAGTAGRRYFETDTGVLFADTGSAWQAVSVGQVLKPSNETVNNSSTLQNDNDLKFPIGVSEKWFVEAVLLAQSASLNADWKFGWTGPTGAIASWGTEGGSAGGAGFILTAVSTATTSLGTVVAIGGTHSIGGLNGIQAVRLAGWFTADASNAGTIQLQWAQNTPTVEDNIILAGSFLQLRRLL